jgi:manganese transport protein
MSESRSERVERPRERITWGRRLKTLGPGLVVTAAFIAPDTVTTSSVAGASYGFDLWAVVFAIFGTIVLQEMAARLGVVSREGLGEALRTTFLAMVVIMSAVFIVTAVITTPDVGGLLAGVFTPSIPSGAALTAVALIGTTIVPYNLFLHSSSVQEKWPESIDTEEALIESRTDTILSISLGGIITAAIVATAAAAFFTRGTEITDAAVMAEQLEPLLGPAAKIFFAVGLFAAGMTSAITAPLAAAYATLGALGWERNLKSAKFRVVWFIILAIGTILAFFGENPVTAIVFAQAANGILLPIVAVFLLVVMNAAISSVITGTVRWRTSWEDLWSSSPRASASTTSSARWE